LVTFSGGKYIGGPQSAGLLAGRKDLIEAALLNSGPEMAVGRPAKVGREEMIGMATALQLFIESDDEQRMTAMKDQADHIHNRLKDLPGITVSVEHDHLQFHVPNCVIKFNGDATAADRVWQALHRGNPRIYIARINGGLAANMVNMASGQELVVADRLIEAINQSQM
jgi:L-seryl-tRNA(Ser) seleniumtransferase